MDHMEFFDRVETHPDLEGLGLEAGADGAEDAVLVRHGPTGAKYRVELATVAAQPWGTLEAIFTGRREPKVLSHMTRVVGYFSRTENWNRSKIGELHARQHGNYVLGPKEVVGAEK